jgi:alkanesulfonate monooxygenase SsuD/methylene tetrahydromethanopterin reductase-like flavin-dependent oxidoreductase (luciferase family)
MLALTVPHVDAWNAWYDWTGNRPEGLGPLREKVDAAARAAGRDPGEIERTVAVLVRLPRASGGREYDAPPLAGSAEAIADGLRAYARQGIGHVQLVIDPITEASLEALAPVLENLDGGR